MNDSGSNFDAIVFDLDGTLWNACEACSVGWTEALQSAGFDRIISKADIESICGLPTPDCVRKLCPEIPVSEFDSMLDIIGEAERKHIELRGGNLYDGVVDGLRKLEAKYPLFLVSNCQSWYLDLFLRLSGTGSLFKDTDCYGRAGKTKLENLKDLALRNGLQRPIYIGDTDGDRIAALGAGYAFAFAEYGFGETVSELKFANFRSLVDGLS